MVHVYRSLRRRVPTPAMSETDLSTRGFNEKNPAGYGNAAESRRPNDVEPQLEELPVRFRGFACEGAATARANTALAQGCAFAATVRVWSGLTVPHNEPVNRVFRGVSVAAAADVGVRDQSHGPADGDVPAYEVWRRRTADEFRARGRG